MNEQEKCPKCGGAVRIVRSQVGWSANCSSDTAVTYEPVECPELAKLRERAERAEYLLHDLTPTGSEFARDPQRCYEWVRDHMSSLLQDAITMAGERNEARRELAKIKAMISTQGG